MSINTQILDVVSAWSGPLGYLLTVPTYGTWLHGDDRGSVDKEHDIFGTPFAPPSLPRQLVKRKSMKHPPFLLDARARRIVQDTIDEVAEHRQWHLHAKAVRTNHMHIVVSAFNDPEPVLETFKSWTTRRLREHGCIELNRKPWARHGSTVYLWKMERLIGACRYVVEGQGSDLPSP